MNNLVWSPDWSKMRIFFWEALPIGATFPLPEMGHWASSLWHCRTDDSWLGEEPWSKAETPSETGVKEKGSGKKGRLPGCPRCKFHAAHCKLGGRGLLPVTIRSSLKPCECWCLNAVFQEQIKQRKITIKLSKLAQQWKCRDDLRHRFKQLAEILGLAILQRLEACYDSNYNGCSPWNPTLVF